MLEIGYHIESEAVVLLIMFLGGNSDVSTKHRGCRHVAKSMPEQESASQDSSSNSATFDL